jgi:hypothetical protein
MPFRLPVQTEAAIGNAKVFEGAEQIESHCIGLDNSSRYLYQVYISLVSEAPHDNPHAGLTYRILQEACVYQMLFEDDAMRKCRPH